METSKGIEVMVSTLRGYEADGSMPRISLLCGNNAPLFLDFETERGADGANTDYYLPNMLADVVRLAAAGKRDEAHDLFDAQLPLIRYEQLQGPGLAVRKYVMMKRGILSRDALRKPSVAWVDARAALK
jgi:4-hydroxy-tetrahydrodipicolinate synthase